ncbi:toxin glutamine deamidase domain-containing protein [Nocardia sp. NBC_00511]|uniref:toxin glutamine deamidase domain-containing protein n=1 Tax=Nocardia sp. NBC_00511 TaxID=2903591 RepID=UPI0030E25492
MQALNFGMAYPKGDQDALFALGDSWNKAASDLEALEPDLRSVTDKVPQYYVGDGATQISAEFATLFDGKDYSIQKLVSNLHSLGHDTRSTATTIEYTKLQEEAFALITLATVASLMASLYGEVLVPAYLAIAREGLAVFAETMMKQIAALASRAALESLAKPLSKEIAVPLAKRIGAVGLQMGKGAIIAGGMGAGLDAGIQGLQIGLHRRDDGFDLKQTFTTGLEWGAGGFVGAPAHTLAESVLKRTLPGLPSRLGGFVSGSAGGVAGGLGMYGAGLGTQYYDKGKWSDVDKTLHMQLLAGGLAMGGLGGLKGGAKHGEVPVTGDPASSIAKIAPADTQVKTVPNVVPAHENPVVSNEPGGRGQHPANTDVVTDTERRVAPASSTVPHDTAPAHTNLGDHGHTGDAGTRAGDTTSRTAPANGQVTDAANRHSDIASRNGDNGRPTEPGTRPGETRPTTDQPARPGETRPVGDQPARPGHTDQPNRSAGPERASEPASLRDATPAKQPTADSPARPAATTTAPAANVTAAVADKPLTGIRDIRPASVTALPDVRPIGLEPTPRVVDPVSAPHSSVPTVDHAPTRDIPADRGPADRSPTDRAPADRAPADRAPAPADRSPGIAHEPPKRAPEPQSKHPHDPGTQPVNGDHQPAADVNPLGSDHVPGQDNSPPNAPAVIITTSHATPEHPQEVRRRIEKLTGVDPELDSFKARDEFEDFYSDQYSEAAKPTEVMPRDSGSPTAEPLYDARRFTYDNDKLTVLTVKVHLDDSGKVPETDLHSIADSLHKSADRTFNTGEHQLLSGDRFRVELEFVDDPAEAHLRLPVENPGKSAEPAALNRNTPSDALAEHLRDHLGLPKDDPALTDVDLRHISNDIALSNTDNQLRGLPGTRVVAPHELGVLESAKFQWDVEDALRDGDRFIVGADPRTNPYGELINDGGPFTDVRRFNCLDQSLAALSSFYGDPQVGLPRYFDKLADGTFDEHGEAGGIPRAKHWLGDNMLGWNVKSQTPVHEQFNWLHQHIEQQGELSAALVINEWHARDDFGNKLYEPDGTPIADGSHATVIVYPRGASSPVWWDPQSRTMSDHPPADLTLGSASLYFMEIDPNGGISGAGAAHSGTGGGVPPTGGPHPGEPSSQHLSDRIRMGLLDSDEPAGTSDSVGEAGHRGLPDRGREDGSGDGLRQRETPDPLGRDVRPIDSDRPADDRRQSDLPAPVEADHPADTAGPDRDRVPSDSGVPDRTAGTDHGSPTDREQGNPPVPDEHGRDSALGDPRTGLGERQPAERDLAGTPDPRVLGADAPTPGHRLDDVHDLHAASSDRPGGPAGENEPLGSHDNPPRQTAHPASESVPGRSPADEHRSISPHASNTHPSDPVGPHSTEALPTQPHSSEVGWAPHIDDEWSQKTAHEISDALKSRWGIDTQGFHNPDLHPEVVREFARAVDDMKSRYPDANVPKVVIDKLPDEYHAAAEWQVLPDGRYSLEALILNEIPALDPEFMASESARLEANGHYVPGSGDRPIHAALVHEFGHVIDIEGQRSAEDTALDTLDRYYRSTRGELDKAEYQKWLDQLSDYSFDTDGQLDPPEALAEAFADVEFNGEAASEPAKVLYWHLLDSANAHSIAPDGFRHIPEDVIARPTGPHVAEPLEPVHPPSLQDRFEDLRSRASEIFDAHTDPARAEELATLRQEFADRFDRLGLRDRDAGVAVWQSFLEHDPTLAKYLVDNARFLLPEAAEASPVSPANTDPHTAGSEPKYFPRKSEPDNPTSAAGHSAEGATHSAPRKPDAETPQSAVGRVEPGGAHEVENGEHGYPRASLDDLGFPDGEGIADVDLPGFEQALTVTELVPTQEVRFTQRSISRETSDGLPIQVLADRMADGGWRGGPIHAVVSEDGRITSLDNRRLTAAQLAGLDRVPTALHAASERLADWPHEWDEDRRQRNPLRVDIRQLPDGTLRVGGDTGEIVYRRGQVAETWGDIALFRSAEQRSLLPGDLGGSDQRPVFAAKPAPTIEVHLAPADHQMITEAVHTARPEADRILADLHETLDSINQDLGLDHHRVETLGEDHRVKSSDSLARKFETERHSGETADSFLNRVNDLVRFSTRLPEGEGYRPALDAVLSRLEERGYEVVDVKNFWKEGNRYLGLNTTLRSPHGREFELQFPTDTAWRANKLTHEPYEVFRRTNDPSPEPIERRIHSFFEILRINEELGLDGMVPAGVEERWSPLDSSLAKWVRKNPGQWRLYESWLQENNRELSWVTDQFGLDLHKHLPGYEPSTFAHDMEPTTSPHGPTDAPPQPGSAEAGPKPT